MHSLRTFFEMSDAESRSRGTLMSSSRKKWPIIAAVVVIIVSAALVAFYAMRTPASKRELRRYQMTGVVLGVRPESRKITVANDNITGFMQAMVMDYNVKDGAALSDLKRGDEIRATLVSDGASQWTLDDITVSPRR